MMLQGRVRRVALAVVLLETLCASPALGALASQVSEALTGQSVPEVEAETLDGRIFKLSDLRGSPVLVNFFASWCPVCQAEDKEIRGVHASYAARGLRFVGVLVDSVETPDTMEAARQQLQRNPLPYPVLLLDPTASASFRYTGFPATYFITSEGQFSTTLYGFQSRDQITAVADRILVGGSSRVVGGDGGSVDRPAWDRAPLLALVPRSWNQWHPALVHFPIAFLLLEAVFVVWYIVTRVETLELFSRWLLTCAVVSFVPTIYTGLGDAGADLGPGWAFWNGVLDRARHLFLLQSTISLHVLFVLATVAIAGVRFAWRLKARERALQGKEGIAFAAVTLLGLWVMFAASQVGGSLSHR